MLKEILQSKRAQIREAGKNRSIASFEGEVEGFKHGNFSEVEREVSSQIRLG